MLPWIPFHCFSSKLNALVVVSEFAASLLTRRVPSFEPLTTLTDDALERAMADDVRQNIIAAITKRGEDSQSGEAYVAHLKIWETEEGGAAKSRFILLSCQSTHQS